MKSLLVRNSASAVGLVVMIPNLAALMAMVLVSHSSDRKLERRYHAAIPAIVGGVALLTLGTAHSAFLSVVLLSVGAAGVYSLYGPFYSLPCELLTGVSAASGIALINSVVHLGGFIVPGIALITQRTGTLYGSFVLSGFALLACAMLILGLRKRRTSQTDTVAMTQASPAAIPTADIDP